MNPQAWKRPMRKLPAFSSTNTSSPIVKQVASTP